MNKSDQSAGTRPAHQTVASRIQFQSANKSIQIGFTGQKLSPHAGTAAFGSFLHGSGWIGLLEKCLPHPLPKSNNCLQPLCKALGFIVVAARLSRPLQGFIKKETAWQATEMAGTDVAELDYREKDWPASARLIVIRHRTKDKHGRSGGKMLFDCPGYLYQGLVTNLPRTKKPLAVWREYNGRAACENIIKELDAGYGLPELACRDFWATEAALSLGVLAHNLIVLFERKLGWLEAVTIGTLRYWLFVTAGVISHAQGQITIKLAVRKKERDWWQRLWDKLLSPFPNCDAVENRPALP